MNLYVYDLDCMLDDTGMIPFSMQIEMRKLRSRGEMILLVSSFHRTCLMQTYYAHANVFLADSGLFGFGGCRCLYKDQSDEKLGKLKSVLDEMDVPYTLQKEDDSSCGGRMAVASNDARQVPLPYLLTCQNNGRIQELQERLKGEYRVEEKGSFYVFLQDDEKREEAIGAIAEQLGAASTVKAN